MSTREKHDTHQKALALNLDTTILGSFAEIRAGKEVARWFLRVRGASVTLAKTIYAYDKEVSDRLYGSGTRYVSRPRLQSMLDCEWDQLLRQLLASCGASTKFFSFVDTVSARNHAGTNGSSIKAFVGYSQDTLGKRSEGRFGESYEPEEGVNRGQPNVPAACAYAPISFQMIEEGPEEGWFQNFHGQLRRRLASLLLCKLQEQAKTVAIARDGIGTCLPLMRQAIGDEGLQEF